MDSSREETNDLASKKLDELFQEALSLEKQGKRKEAIGVYLQAIEFDPNICEFHQNVGHLYLQENELAQALASYKKAIDLNPEYAEAYVSCANVFSRLGQHEEAIAFCEFALKIKPNELTALFNLACHYRALEKLELAQSSCKRVLELCPDFLQARLLKLQLALPRIYDNLAQQQQARLAYEEELAALERDFDQLIATSSFHTLEMMSSYAPYFLPYQGKNDRSLQVRFSTLLTRLAKKHHGAWLEPLAMPPFEGRLRIGFVSGFFSQHSVWKIPLGGWIDSLDKARFETFAYATKKSDPLYLQQAEHAFEESNLKNLIEKIKSDQLHVLFFSELGMDAKSLSLAALRLAPIQVTGLGHPQTSGLSTIDYFLSSELMEQSDAQEHYSECLVPLSGLGLSYLNPPGSCEPLGVLEDLLEEGRIRYFCAQSLFKYLPQYDFIWPEIAKKVPRAQFIFTSTPLELADAFFERLKKAFQREGLLFETFVIRLPRVTPEQYASLCKRCDLFLDSIGWSGFNSTIEALQQHLPVITRPGIFARERHSMAVLRFLQIEETIAQTIEEYLAIAIELGLNKKKREHLKHKIEKNISKLYRDPHAIESLERFLVQVTKINEPLS